MATRTTTRSKATLESAQRAWLRKMGAALDTPVADAGAAAARGDVVKGLGPEDIVPIVPELIKTLTAPHSCLVRIVNDSGLRLKLDPLSLRDDVEEDRIGISHGKYDSMPPNSLEQIGEFKASSNTVLGQTFTGVEARVRYFLDEQKTAWIIHFNNPKPGKNTADVLLDGPNKAQFESPEPSKTSGADAMYLFTLKRKGDGPSPRPGGVDAASSCHVTVTNDTQLTLTLVNQGHERGDFMTFPEKSLAPGASTTFVSVETPNNIDPKDEGCKGFLLWQVGSPDVLWRVEWDNPEQQKNTATADFNPRNAGFNSLNQIGQGEENVPVSFTISGSGSGLQPPPSIAELSVTVIDRETDRPIPNATVDVAGQSERTDDNGEVVFEVVPGNYPYKVTADGYLENTGTVEVPGDGAVLHVMMDKEEETEFNPPPESKQPTLRKGDQSVDGWVEYLQKLLNKYLGAGTVPEDGVFDQRTYDAVKKFQASTKPPCLVDGIVGNETWSMLRKGQREAVGVNEQGDEQGAEGRWATEKDDFVTYDPDSDELRMVAFSVGDAPIDTYKARFRITSEDKRVQKKFDRVIGAPTGPSPTGAGHMHVVKVQQMSVTYGNGEHLVETYLDEKLGGDLWTGRVNVKGRGTSDKTGNVTFGVIDVTTTPRSGIPDATVTLALADQSDITDPRGIVLFDKVPAGKQPFTATHPDYEPTSGEVDVVADEQTRKPVVLNPKTAPPSRDKTGNVKFGVIDVTTTPRSGIRDAKVSIAGRDKLTDPRGIVLFDKVPAGRQPFTASHEDYDPTSGEVEVVADEDTGKPVVLNPKKGPPKPDVKTGKVVFGVSEETTNRKIPGATVTFRGESKMTDEESIADFGDVAVGKYPFTVSHPHYESVSGELEVRAGGEHGKMVELKPKATPPNVTGEVKFTVTASYNRDTDIYGHQISKATVEFAGRTESTDDRGEATFESVLQGGYPYLVSKEGYARNSGAAVVQAGKQTSERVELRAEHGSITIRVYSKATGEPIKNARVTVAKKSKSTDGWGSAYFPDIANGSYDYSVDADAYRPARGTVEVEGGRALKTVHLYDERE